MAIKAVANVELQNGGGGCVCVEKPTIFMVIPQ